MTKHYFFMPKGSKRAQRPSALRERGLRLLDPLVTASERLVVPRGTRSCFERTWMWESALAANADFSSEVKSFLSGLSERKT